MKFPIHLRFLILPIVLLLAACSNDEQAQAPAAADESGPTGADAITADGLAADIRVLASDEFEGRGPSTPGEEKTLAYLESQLSGMGVSPANEGSFRQAVPLVSITAGEDAKLSIAGGGADPLNFAYRNDMVIWTHRLAASIDVQDSDLVFVGYGIVAPEYNWNDYAGLDVKGKTVVILVNDPGYATQDPALFNGNAMTYYGRWTYKYEEAARQGAAAAIIVHETAPAAYGWEVVENSWTGPQMDIDRGDSDSYQLAVEGWITSDAANKLFERAGQDFAALKAAALKPDFKAVDLGLKASMSLNDTIARSTSANIVGLLEGSTAPDEYFIYMAHWDHLGRDPSLEGDQIYNGAVDNASGSAAVLELAKAFATLKDRPGRSILFIFPTAEEKGLLGSEYYAEHPLVPESQTVAGLNIDGINNFGRTRDISIIGYGMSDLDAIMDDIISDQGRRVVPDPETEKGYYYRSDHFELAKKGVPMIYPDTGIDMVNGGEEAGRAARNDYVVNHYHKPADEYSDDWDLSGAVEDIRAYFDFGLEIANSTEWPNWNQNSEFRAARDASHPSDGDKSD